MYCDKSPKAGVIYIPLCVVVLLWENTLTNQKRTGDVIHLFPTKRGEKHNDQCEHTISIPTTSHTQQRTTHKNQLVQSAKLFSNAVQFGKETFNPTK